MLFLKGLESKLKWDIFWVGLIQLANYFFPFITTTYLIRTIGVGHFGRIELASLVVLYFITLTNYEFHISGTRKISLEKNNHEKLVAASNDIFSTKIFLFVISTVVFALMVLIWPVYFNNFLYLSTYLIVFGHLLYQPHIFMGTGNVRLAAVLNFIVKALSTILIFISIREPVDYESVNLNYSISYIIIGLTGLVIAIIKFRLNFIPGFKRIFRILKEGFYIFLTHGLLAQLSLNFSAILIGFYLSSVDLGNYSAALKVIIALHVIVFLPMKQVFFPLLPPAWQEMKPEFFKKFNTYLSLSVFLNFILGFVILFSAPWIIKLIYGDHYEQMIFILRMFSFIPFLAAVTTVFNDGLLSAGKDRKVFLIQLAIAIINILAIFFVIPYFGIKGALITRIIIDSICLVVVAIAYYNLVKPYRIV